MSTINQKGYLQHRRDRKKATFFLVKQHPTKEEGIVYVGNVHLDKFLIGKRIKLLMEEE